MGTTVFPPDQGSSSGRSELNKAVKLRQDAPLAETLSDKLTVMTFIMTPPLCVAISNEYHLTEGFSELQGEGREKSEKCK